MNAFLNNDDFDGKLSNMMGNAEMEPAEGSWERLQLKKTKAAYRKKIHFWIYLSSITIVLLLLALIFHDQVPFLSGKTRTVSNADQRIPISGVLNNGSLSQKITNAVDEKNTTANEEQKTSTNFQSIQCVTLPVSQENKSNNITDEIRSSIITNDNQKTETGSAINYIDEIFSESTYISDKPEGTTDNSSVKENIAAKNDTATNPEVTTSLNNLNVQKTDTMIIKKIFSRNTHWLHL